MEIHAVEASPSHKGSVLILGTPEPRSLKLVEGAAADSNLSTSVCATLGEVDRLLEGIHKSARRPWSAIVVELNRGREAACLHLRYDPALANVPIVATAEAITDLTFEELYGSGGDDLARRGDRETLARRLRLCSAGAPAALPQRHGTAIVLDSDRRHRVLMARILRNAGYGVTFAVDADEAVQKSKGAAVELVLSTAAFEIETHPVVQRARFAGVNVPWVIAASPKDCARLRAATRGIDKVAVYDCFGAPENVLFVVNELTRSGANARTSPRVLYGTSVRFRAAGTETDEIGYSYNLSAGGVYVRTLAPLPRGSEAWIELRPPRCDRRVRLEGRVVWTRGFGPNDSATVPPGFGLQITGGARNDIDRFERGYSAFAAEVLGAS